MFFSLNPLKVHKSSDLFGDKEGVEIKGMWRTQAFSSAGFAIRLLFHLHRDTADHQDDLVGF